MSILKRIICNAIWLINDKTGTLGNVPDKIPDYEYEAIARSFLTCILDYFGKEENVQEFEAWKKDYMKQDPTAHHSPEEAQSKTSDEADGTDEPQEPNEPENENDDRDGKDDGAE